MENPFNKFNSWFKDAENYFKILNQNVKKEWFDGVIHSFIEDSVFLPNAAHLSTISRKNQPSNRVILIKGIDEEGFRFYTNYNSRKSYEISKTPGVALTFYWPIPPRQIRINGIVEKLSNDESDMYWSTRPFESQIGALASQQSQVLSDRNALISNFNSLKQEYEGKKVPRPNNWGGFIVKPHKFEFWEGQLNRLHNREEFEFVSNCWQKQLLYP